MVQIDVFLTYGLGSALALASERQQPEPERRSSRFSLTLLWLAVAFSPQTAYLLWRFPAWETMFAFVDHAAIPAWLAALIGAAMVVCGAAGYWASSALVRRGHRRLAIGLAALAFALPLEFVTLGWDGRGYRRLLYAGSGADWQRGIDYPLVAFLSTDVALTLAWLVPLVMLPYAVLLLRFARARADA